MAEASTHPNRWLYGPIPDLLFGCGVLYALTSLVFAVDGGAIFRAVPLAVPALLIALVSAPHYGATLVRVYDQREDRRAYFLFSVVATVALVAVFGIALFERWTGSLLATVYLTWAGWHYTGQNYGISAMFLRRRGIELEGPPRRCLHLSFVLSYALVFLVMHGQGAPLADPGSEVRLIPLGIPRAVNAVLLPLIVLGYLGTTLAWAVLLARRADRISDLAPTLLISGSQALWWSIPYAARFFDFGAGLVPVGWDSRSLFFPWIACAHALQYLWITSFYARSSGRWNGQVRYYLGVLTAGSAVWALPALVFAPGRDAFDWNFALLLASVVNVHHFILDGAIWKLRHMKIARILIADVPSDAAPAVPSIDAQPALGRTIRKLVWAGAAVGLVLTGHSLLERYVIAPAAIREGDFAAAAESFDRQAWLGKTSAFNRFQLGRRLEDTGDTKAAIAQFEISASMEPRVEVIKRLIGHYQRSGDVQGFVRSCDRLFELEAVERPMPTPDIDKLGGWVPERFKQACIRVARATKPPTSDAGDPTGGAGKDGGVSERAEYE